VERRSPAVCKVSDHKEGKDEMTKASIDLQDLRRRIYVKAKAETSWKFWGLYVHVCKLDTLREAYGLAKKNDGAPGSDGVTFEAVEAQGVEAFLGQIADELVGRSYAPLPARRQEIPKDGGKVRVLSIPAIRDRVVQGALNPRAVTRGQSSRRTSNRGRSDIVPNGQPMKRWTVWRERSFGKRRAASTSTCAAISTMSGMIGCWRK
jgi:hypothetical protein